MLTSEQEPCENGKRCYQEQQTVKDPGARECVTSLGVAAIEAIETLKQ